MTTRGPGSPNLAMVMTASSSELSPQTTTMERFGRRGVTFVIDLRAGTAPRA